MEQNNENTTDIERENHQVWLYADWIKQVYPLLKKYFGFKYSDIGYEISNSLRDTFDYHTMYLKAGDIEHLPDDFKIYFQIGRSEYDNIMSFADKYEIEDDDALYILIILLYSWCENIRNRFYGLEDINVVEELFIKEEKRKLYEFLLDNPHRFDELNRAKAQIEIRYGWDSQIGIDNYENWFDNLLLRALHHDLTYGGRFEYVRNEGTQKPTRAPSFSNFIAYNTYLMLKGEVGSESKYPAEFSKFIIDFCNLCEVVLIERQQSTIGMKEFLTHANRQYKGEPIPLSSVR